MSAWLNAELNAVPTTAVSYLGIPFAAKNWRGVWFYMDADGEYRRFIAQDKVVVTAAKGNA